MQRVPRKQAEDVGARVSSLLGVVVVDADAEAGGVRVA